MINTAVAADFTGEGNWKEKKKKSKDYGKRSTDGGGNRLVQTWQWVSGALLITVALSVGWMRGTVWYVAVRGGTQARRERWLVFIVLLTADISANFVREIPSFWSSVCHQSEVSKYTTPLCDDVGFCPWDTAAKQETMISFGWISMWIRRKRSRRTLAFNLESPQ